MKRPPIWTDLKIKNLKPSDKPYEEFDPKFPGGSIRVYPTGKKSFCLHYRDLCGKSVRATVGHYPYLSVAEVHEKWQAIRKDLAKGIDPKVKKLKETERRKVGKIENVVAEHVEGLKSRNKSALESERVLLRVLVKTYGALDIRDLDKPLIRKILAEVTKESGNSSANHAFAEIRRLCRESVGRGYLDRSPCEGMKKPHPTVHRDRVLSDSELIAIWRAAESMNYPVAPYYKLLMFTGQRRCEVSKLKWSSIDFSRRRWLQAKDENKAGRKHLVPLSDHAVAVLKAIPRLNDTYVFPGRGVPRPMSGFSKWKAKVSELSGVSEWTLHDLRRTMATAASARLKTPIHVIELILNHSAKELRGVAGVYIRNDFEDEKRKALQAWADYLTRLVEDRPVNSVAETEELPPDAA